MYIYVSMKNPPRPPHQPPQDVHFLKWVIARSKVEKGLPCRLAMFGDAYAKMDLGSPVAVLNMNVDVLYQVLYQKYRGLGDLQILATPMWLEKQ